MIACNENPGNTAALEVSRGNGEPLDRAGATLEDPGVEVASDAVLVVTGSAVAIRERGSARAKLLADGALDGLQGHFLGCRAPQGFVWCVLVEPGGTRVLLHTRAVHGAAEPTAEGRR